MTYAQDLASRFKAVALRNGLWLTDEELECIVSSVLYSDDYATRLTQFEFQLKAILLDLGLFEKQKFGAYRLFYKGGDTWSIRNGQNKEILAGSKERMLKVLEAHQGEVKSRPASPLKQKAGPHLTILSFPAQEKTLGSDNHHSSRGSSRLEFFQCRPAPHLQVKQN